MSDITITHTHAEGTLIDGSRKGDGVWEVLKGLGNNWRYFRSLGQIGLGQSRDRAADTYKIKRAAEALRKAGHEVTVTVDESQRRDVATIEAERAERAEARTERYEERAERRGTEAGEAYARARQMSEAIPFGQPILTDHYSARGDRRYRERISRTYDRAFEGMREAEQLQGRAQAAEATQAHRENVPTTLRRIEKLEADARRIQRRLDGTDPSMSYGKPATGEWRERLEALAADAAEQITYWRGHVAKRQAEEGVKVWAREDFTKGDYVQFHGTWYEVVRVSGKSVTIPAMINDGPIVHQDGNRCTWTDTIPYHKVTGRKSAAGIAEILAAAEVKAAS